MHYEPRKVLAALLSVGSVGAMLVVAIAMEAMPWYRLEPFALASVGAAAAAAYLSILWSRRLAKERDKRRVFLIYAREDIDAAKRLAELLRGRGFHPWLDVDEVKPGEIWRKSVLRALEESWVALVLVSEHLEKKGFVQQELKMALAALQETERDVSPVIPVRLTDSPVPEGLADVQWVNLFASDGLDQLEEGLRKSASVRGTEPTS